MKISPRLLLIAALFALVLPLVFTGNAMAIYAGDGTKPNATGTWDITDHGVCVTGVKSDGTLVIDNTITSRPDCLAKTWPAYTTQAACLASDAAGANVEGSHYWASTCVATDGTPISLNGLDRTNTMCAQAAAAAGKTATAMANACTSAWVYTGPAGDGAPGFCYTTIDVTADYPTLAQCPTGSAGYTWWPAPFNTNGACLYAYGISGTLGLNNSSNTAAPTAWSAMNYKRGGAYVAAHGAVNLTGFSQGLCLADGGSWSTGTTKSGTTTLTSGAVVANVTNTRAGCLECHNNTSQNNGYAGRWKTSYMLTGHKNMLRKVAQDGSTPWKGPDANGALQTYTAAAEGNVYLSNVPPTADVSEGAGKPLLYLFGDWMAPAPGGLDVIVDMGTGVGAKYNGGSNYSCAACHTAGWSNSTAGLCSLSSKTTQAACTGAGGTWTPLVGRQGASYVPAEPAASFPSVNFNGIGSWDRDGIMCSRCHESVFVPSTGNSTVNSLGATSMAALTGTSSHNVTPGSNSNQQVNTICYGCHQSVAKTVNGTGADADLSSATNIPVKNNVTAPAYQPEFSGHVLGGSFLNSPHARYTGTISVNPLGKYDLTTNTTANYNSAFKGFVCRSSTTVGSGSVLETVIKSGVEAEIKSKADCNLAASNTTADPATGAYWQAESQGSCTTCHDVHNSLFVVDSTQKEPLRRECAYCHVDNAGSGRDYASLTAKTTINHPGGVTGDGTPLADIATKPSSPCEICHMPKATDGGFPMHLWRINPDSSYTTFPTAAEFGIGATATLKNARTFTETGITTGGATTYSGAVAVDVTNSCGQCHIVGTAPALTAAQLSIVAADMHVAGAGNALTNANCLSCHSAAVGTKRAINPGVDHHNGSCQTCHAAGNGHFKSAWDTAGVAAPSINATTKKTNTRETPNFDYWSINSSLPTACLGCHSVAQPKSGGGTVAAIVPSGTGDNHHNGHSSVPGTAFGGVAKGVGVGTGSTPGSRGDNDPGMNCLGCHGKSTITGGNSTVGYTMKFAASGLNTSTVASQNGRTNTSGLCLGCHEVIQSGTTQDHHVGQCLNCHKMFDPTALQPGVATVPAAWDNCTACHLVKQGTIPAVTMMNTKHPQGTGTPQDCKACHSVAANATATPPTIGSYVGALPDIASTCGQCHGADASTSTLYANFAKTMHASSGTPDLKMNAATVPVFGNGTATDTVTNVGTAEIGPTTTNYYLSADTKLDAGDILIGSRAVPALVAGQQNTGSTTITLPGGLSTGTYYVIVKADGPDAVAETSETNNTMAIPISVGPDLRIGTMTVPAFTTSSAVITVSDMTFNASGMQPAGASTTKYYWSTNTTLDDSDTLLASRAVPALNGGQSSTGSVSITIPNVKGTYYLFAKADAGATPTGQGVVSEVYETNNTMYRVIVVK